MSAAPQPYLDKGGRRYPLRDGVTFIGRDESCDIHLLDQGLSRQHAMVIHDEGKYVILDFKSQNGIYVNGRRVERATLSPGDNVQMGQNAFTFVMPSRDEVLRREQSTLFEMLTQQIKIEPGKGPKGGAPAKEEAAGPRRGFQQDTVKKLMNLYQVSKAINSELDLNKVLALVVDKALEVLNADRGLIAFTDEKGGVSVKASRNMNDLTPDGGLSTISQSIVRGVVEGRKPVLAKDAMADSRFSSSQSIQIFNIRSAMCAPLLARDRLIGMVYVDNRLQSEALEEDDLLLLSAYADQAAIAVENARLYAAIQEETKRRTNLQRFFSPDVVEKILSAESQLSREKVTATVLFSDVRGFTSFSEGNDAETVVGVLNDYLDRMSTVILEEQGTVDKFLGDGIMAVFGAPFPRSDSPFLAVKAAWKMQEAMRELNDRWQSKGLPQQGIGIGIHTGELISGSVGSKDRVEYTVIGDTVNTTSRLNGVAGPGDVILSQATYQILKDRVEADPLAPVQVKGKREPIQVYRLKGIVD